MANQQIAPRADQPRATGKDTARVSSSPNLQYRIQGVQSFNKGTSTRSPKRVARY